MNEWKNLEISNLPPDILTGDYEIEYQDRIGLRWFETSNIDERWEIIKDLSGGLKYRYRKPETSEEPS